MNDTRRQFLAALAAGATGALAGCGGDDVGETPRGTGTATETDSPTATDTSTATDTPAATDTPTATETPTATPTPTVDADQRVAVGPGSFVFDPESFEIAVGETVLWEWASSNHNVKPETTPSGSDWNGTPGDGTYDEGYTYSYTFDVAGEYSYYCSPHRSAGMVGSFTVVE